MTITEHRQNRQPVILIVDDTPGNIQILAQALSQDYSVRISTNGQAALELLKEAEKPDLILLDVLMPEMDGYEVCRRIKADPTLKDIPVIFLTAMTDDQSESSGLALGAVDYITKPINIDITKKRIRNHLEREQLLHQLEQHRDQLEKQVQERTFSLSIAKEAAETANRAKSTFLRNMSHEFRTPMHGVLGMVSLLKAKATDPWQKEKLAIAEQSAQKLLGLLDNLLDMSRIESGRMTLASTAFRLGEILESVRNTTAVLAQAKLLKLNVDAPESLTSLLLKGDPQRLGQVLTELINNAIKFSMRGDVTLRVIDESHEADTITLRFEVSDEGIGIAPDDQRRIFEAFEQADGSNTRQYGGAGIGLRLCKQLIQLMGGTIGVKDNPAGQGSIFWFVVPLAKVSGSTADSTAVIESARAALRDKHSGSKILVVEDDKISQAIVKETLQDAGMDVFPVSDGGDAVKMAQAVHFDLILMDLMLPTMNGVDASYAIRAMPHHQKTPILAVTARAFAEDRDACLRAGMNAHVPKPIVPDVLLNIVLEWLTHSRPVTN